jgi:hypothetical protein
MRRVRTLVLFMALGSTLAQAAEIEAVARQYGVALWARLNCAGLELLTPQARAEAERVRAQNRTRFDKEVGRAAATFNAGRTLEERYETCETLRRDAPAR